MKSTPPELSLLAIRPLSQKHILYSTETLLRGWGVLQNTLPPWDNKTYSHPYSKCEGNGVTGVKRMPITLPPQTKQLPWNNEKDTPKAPYSQKHPTIQEVTRGGTYAPKPLSRKKLLPADDCYRSFVLLFIGLSLFCKFSALLRVLLRPFW